MNVRPSAWLLTALAAAVLLTGCGGGSSSSSSTTAAPGSASTQSTSGPASASAIAACKQAIKAQATLPAGAKGKLEGVCAKAASGDQAAVRKAAQEVCEEVIDKSAIPAGVARQNALKACKITK
jgi:hypothetical protein